MKIFLTLLVMLLPVMAANAAPAPKISICHNDRVISISGNALEAHLAHGDGVVGLNVDEDCLPIDPPPPPDDWPPGDDEPPLPPPPPPPGGY